MPRERTEFIRDKDSLNPEKFFILAYEGNKTEQQYFEGLKDQFRFNEKEKIYVHSLKRNRKDGSSDPKNVFNKLKGCTKEYNFKITDEFWMIIDRDSWNCLDEIVEMCKKESNFFIALSNPCFELWLILHIRDLQDVKDEEKETLFKNGKVNASKNYIDEFLGSLLSDGYNKTRIKPKRFLPNIDLAIKRAEDLDLNKDVSYPIHLGSHVYKLVKRLFEES